MDGQEEREEVWFTDPYGRHEARWLSDGKPTKLVRDNGVESYKDPPNESPSREPIPIVGESHLGNVDMRRADDADNATFDPDVIQDAPYGAGINSWLGATEKLPRYRRASEPGLTSGLLSHIRNLVARRDPGHPLLSDEPADAENPEP
jgi:hypothetical protein